MSIYKPSNISPNFEELILSDISEYATYRFESNGSQFILSSNSEFGNYTDDGSFIINNLAPISCKEEPGLSLGLLLSRIRFNLHKKCKIFIKIFDIDKNYLKTFYLYPIYNDQRNNLIVKNIEISEKQLKSINLGRGKDFSYQLFILEIEKQDKTTNLDDVGCYDPKADDQKDLVIFGGSFRLSFQVNTNGSTIRSYKISFHKANELSREDEQSLIGNIFGVLDRDYKNKEICNIAISQKQLISNGIFLMPGRNYKWQIRLYEDIIEIPESIVEYDFNIDPSDIEHIQIINSDGIAELIDLETAFKKYGIYAKNVSFNRDSNKSMFVENYSLNQDIKFKIQGASDSISYNGQEIKEEGAPFSNTILNTDLDLSGSYTTQVVYRMGKDPVNGATYLGEGQISGSTDDIIWIKGINPQIDKDSYIEVIYDSERVLKNKNPNLINEDNTNNSDFCPFVEFRTDEQNTFMTAQNYGQNQIRFNNLIVGNGKGSIKGWNGRQIFCDSGQRNLNDDSFTISRKFDFTNLIEKWYVDMSQINDDLIQYFRDGNTWIKINIPSEGGQSTRFKEFEDEETKIKLLYDKHRFSDYKRVVSAGYDRYGFYFGINASEGICSILKNEEIGKVIKPRSFSKYSYWRQAYYLNESSPLFNSNQVNITYSLMYKQREKIKRIENSVGGLDLSFLLLDKDLNFNKFQYGDGDWNKAKHNKSGTSICCVNKRSDDFTDGRLYIAPKLSGISSGSSYVNIYYMPDEKLEEFDATDNINSSKQYRADELPPTCFLINSYEFNNGSITINGTPKGSVNTGWKYQILSVTGRKSVSETENVDILSVVAYGNLGDSQVYIKQTSQLDNIEDFEIYNENQFEVISTNFSPFDIGYNPNYFIEGDILDNNNKFRLFIDPNSSIKTDEYKSMFIELYNDKDSVKLSLDNLDINKLNDFQNLLSFDFNQMDYFNNIYKEELFSGVKIKKSFANSDIDPVGVHPASPLYQLTRPGTRFKIYSNFIDSDDEGYIYVRPNKKLVLSYIDIYKNSIIVDSSSVLTCRDLQLDLQVKDCDYSKSIRHNIKNESKINWYEIQIYNDLFSYTSGRLYDSKFKFNVDGINPGVYSISVYAGDEYGKIFYRNFEQVTIQKANNDLYELIDSPDSDLYFKYDCNKNAVEISAIRDVLKKVESDIRSKLDWNIGQTEENPDISGDNLGDIAFDNFVANSEVRIQIYKKVEGKDKDFVLYSSIKDTFSNMSKLIYDYNIDNFSYVSYRVELSISRFEEEDTYKSLKRYYTITSPDIFIKNDKYFVYDLQYDVINNCYNVTDLFVFHLNVDVQDTSKNGILEQFTSLNSFNKFGYMQKDYRQGGFSCLLGDLDFIDNKFQCYETNDKYIKWKEFVSNGNIKFVKYPSGESYLCSTSESSETQFDLRVRHIPSTIKFNWVEIDDHKKFSIISIE